MVNLVSERLKSFRELNDLLAELTAICARLLMKDPAEKTQNAVVKAAALKEKWTSIRKTLDPSNYSEKTWKHLIVEIARFDGVVFNIKCNVDLVDEGAIDMFVGFYLGGARALIGMLQTEIVGYFF
jgi:hypothetical protein